MGTSVSKCFLVLFWLNLIFLSIGRGPTYKKSEIKHTFNISCDPNQSELTQQGECQGETLESIAAAIEANSLTHVQIDIEVTLLHLSANISFTNLTYLVINGGPNATNVVCSSYLNTNTGIVLSDIKETVSLRHLNFMFCGTEVKNMFEDEMVFTSALTFVYCTNIDIEKVVIAKSRGVGLTILNHRGGLVNISSTVITDNKQPQEYIAKSLLGGGGVYLQLGRIRNSEYFPMTFYFEECIFQDNVQHTREYNFLYTNVVGEVQKGSGRGGGVHVYVRTGLRNVFISFCGCQFIDNQAFVGGGLAAKISAGTVDRRTENITVNIKHSSFKHNGCSDTNGTGFGGGIYLTFRSYLEASSITNSHFLIENVKFTENCAEMGGGVFYSSNHDGEVYDNAENSILYDGCTFERNQAHIGSALLVIPNTFSKLSTSHTITPIFRDCQFSDNVVFTTRSQSVQRSAGVGTIYSTQTNIQFQGHNYFVNNHGSAVYIVNGIVNFKNSSLSFFNNTALNGGAVALIGSSTMIVGSNDYEFINNRAIYYGGAVYVLLTDSTDFSISRSCFIQFADDDSDVTFSKWNANVTFIGNEAKDSTAGHAIYSTTLYPCQVIKNGTVDQPEYTFVNVSDVFTIRGILFDNDTTFQPQMATDATLFHGARSTPLLVIPGEKYHHGVTVTDDLDQEINASFRATINKVEKHVKLDSDFSRFVGADIQLRGEPRKNATLYLQTISPRQTYVQLEVLLVDCPPGFKLSVNSKCVCNVDAYVGLFKCDVDRLYCHLLPGYWAGHIIESSSNTSALVTSQCPFCEYNSLDTSEFEVVLPQSHSQLSKTVCGETRTGVLCGKCQKEYSVHFHSPNFLCKSATKPAGCKLGWLFYILSELVPVTVVFITVLVLNISFTSGAVNGFILYSQLLTSLDIDASGIINFPEPVKKNIKGWTEAYQIFYGFFNLDFFNSDSLSFCLWKNATALDMAAIKYITILYTLLLIVAVIWIMNKCGGKCCGKHCRITTIKTSAIHGLSTFLIICYTQCVKVSLNLLGPVHFYIEEGSSFRPPVHVWLNGELEYFSKEHLVYALPALACLVTIGLLPPVLLLSYPLLNKVMTFIGCENHKVLSFISRKVPISNMKPLFDSFQGCFKDNLRFFAGLYFLYRWGILLIYISTKGLSSYYVSVIGFLAIMLTIHTICQPYVNRVHNIIDTLLLSNLLIITSLTYYNYFRSYVQRRLRQGVTISPAIVQLILIYLPFAVMLVYFLVVLCSKCGCKFKVKNRFKKSNTLRELIQSIDRRSKDFDSDEDEEFIHDRFDDDNVDYRSGCGYTDLSSATNNHKTSTY